MYVYFVVSEENIKRIIEISKKIEFIICLDFLEVVIKINKMVEIENVIINYNIIVDSGLYCFGVFLKNLLIFVEELKKLKYLKLKGILFYFGYVYFFICEVDI